MIRAGAFRWVILATLLAGPRVVGAQTDFLPDNVQWNGLSEFATIAEGIQIPVTQVERIEWDKLKDDTIVMIIGPTSNLGPGAALSFLDAGGRLVIADDFGSADALLAQLGITRYSGTVKATSFHRGNPALPFAAVTQHDLTHDCSYILANHPGWFRSGHTVVAGWNTMQQQLVVTGKRGKGSFVAIADPSVLINAMLQFDGNIAFATNLLRTLGRPGRDRIVIVTGHFTQFGKAPSAKAFKSEGPADGFNAFVDRINDFVLTGGGMRLLTLLGALAILVILAVKLTQQPPPNRGDWLRATGNRPHRPALEAAILLRDEFEELLAQVLSPPSPIETLETRWLTQAVEQRFGRDAGQLCATLLRDFDGIPRVGKPDLAIGFITGFRPPNLTRIYPRLRRLAQLLGQHHLPELSPNA